jgi:rhamnosyltransferase
MTDRIPACSVVVRAHNEQAHLGLLLQGILKQTVRDVEILLVDSGSTDGTLDVASRYPVRVLQIEPQAFTFGRSLNLGLSAARAPVAVIASAHIYPVYPDWLEQLLKLFKDPRVALAYGRQRGASSTRFSEQQIFAKLYPPRSSVCQDPPFCNNANAAVRRELWQEHPYDEDLSGLEDLAWALWVQRQGFCVAYSAEAEVVHVHQERAAQVYNRYRREAMALKRIRPEEHFGLRDCLRFFVGNVISDARFARQEGNLRRVAAEVVWFRWMQFWGTYRGFSLSGPLTSQLKRVFYYPRDSYPSASHNVVRPPAIAYDDASSGPAATP